MYIVNGKTIIVTRGDTLKINISLKDSTGHEYVAQPDDIIKFKLKKIINDNHHRFEKIINNNTMQLELSSEETSKLSVGDYIYDLEITFSNGEVNTPLNCEKFIVREDV